MEGDAGGRRRAARGPRARPGRRPCGSRRPTASAPRRCRPRRGPGCAGSARWLVRRLTSSIVVYWRLQSTDRPSRRNSSSNAASSVGRRARGTARRSWAARSGTRGALGRVAAVRRRERRVEGLRRVAAHAVEVLHPALGGQAVVVPADRVEDGLAAHPLVAGEGVGLGVAEHVPDVDASRDTVGGGVSMENTSARSAVRSKR